MALMYVQKRNRTQPWADALQQSLGMFAKAIEQRAVSNDMTSLATWLQQRNESPDATKNLAMPTMRTPQGNQLKMSLMMGQPGMMLDQLRIRQAQADLENVPTDRAYKQALTEQAQAQTKRLEQPLPEAWTPGWFKQYQPGMTDEQVKRAIDIHFGLEARPSTKTAKSQLEQSLQDIRTSMRSLEDDFGGPKAGMEEQWNEMLQTRLKLEAMQFENIKGTAESLTKPPMSAVGPTEDRRFRGPAENTPEEAAALARIYLRKKFGREPSQDEIEQEAYRIYIRRGGR